MPFHSLVDPAAMPAALRGAVYAIGNFDGVHRGHRAVIEAAKALARPRGAPVLALTFEPHPRSVFRPEPPLFRLSSPAVKASLLDEAGLDGVVTLTFDRVFAETSADAFLTGLLIGRLGARGLAVGEDFHFGKGRAGTPAFLEGRAPALELALALVPPVMENGVAISSSAVRRALEQGDIATANSLLGHPWRVRESVIHGEKIGRTLGYPTANMRLDRGCRLRHGIYAVRATVDGAGHDGVASYGRRPTFDNGPPLLETYLFDVTPDLYGRVIDIEFHAFLRGEEKFDTVEALIARMDEDARIARSLLAARPEPV